MKVNAEVRDTQKLNKSIRNVIIVFAVYIAALTASIVCAGVIGGAALVAAALLITIAGIPIIIIAAKKAAKDYNNTWMNREFELYAKDGSLYCEGTKLQVNQNKKSDVLYAHDLGTNGNPSKASIYLTIEGDDKDNLLDYKKIISDPKFKEGIDALSEQFDCNLRITLENTEEPVGYTAADRDENPRHKVTISKKSGFKLNGYKIYITLSMGFFQFASPKDEDKFGQMLVSVLLHEIFHNITTLLMWDNAAWIGSYMATITRAIQTKSPKVKKILIQKYIENMEKVSGRKMNKIKKLTLQKQLFTLCSAKQLQKAFDSAKSLKKKVESSTVVSGNEETKSADAYAEILINNLNKIIPELKEPYKTKPGKVACAIISWICTIGFGTAFLLFNSPGAFVWSVIIGTGFSAYKTRDAASPAMLKKTMEQFKSGKDLEEQFADAFAAMYKLPVVFHFVPSEDPTQKYKYNELSTKNLDKLVSLFKEFGTLIMDEHPTDFQRASQAMKAAKQILDEGGKYVDSTQKKYLEWLVNGFDSIEDTSVDDVVQGESPVFDPEATADLNKHLENLIQHGRKNINITESFNFNDLMDKREMTITESERPTVAIIDGKVAVLDPNAEEKTWSNP